MELTIKNLSKEYGKKKAVRCFNATLTNGVYGLLGANGAGKTTLMRMICDVQTETKGVIMLNGKNIHDLGEQYRNILGYLPQHFGYYPNFTAYKFLMYIAAIKGLPHQKAHKRSLELLEKVGLSEQKNVKIKTFSGGMKQRLGIAQALLNNPKILILDEPTAGLDPKERVRFRNLISAFAKDRIVILSTHIVSDVEFIAEEIIMMKSGQIVHFGKPQEITSEIDGQVWECIVPAARAEKCAAMFNTSNLRNTDRGETVLRIIADRPPMEDAVRVQPNLEDLYFCPETMGKLAQIGTLEEVVDFCKTDKVFLPAVDFGHLNAREGGSLKTVDDYVSRLEYMIAELGYERVKHFHVHFSKIMYGGKGEIKHLTFEDDVYGPEFEPFAAALKKLKLEPYIVCESSGTQAEDAREMKRIYETLTYKL